MIHIDTSKLRISSKWKTLANDATDQLLKLRDEERASFLENHAHLWQDLKSAMQEVSHRKCWYCEGRTSRFDFHVDHYRPKNRVRNKDGTQEPGYAWLAFDHANFRLACDYCDSAHRGPGGTAVGKADQFPLKEGSLRASSPGSNIIDELPLLLDPTRPSDPLLLWFLDDGTACPASSAGFPHTRATETIRILNLNYVATVEDRRRIWNRCMELIQRADRAWEQYKTGSPVAIQEFDHLVQDLRELTIPSAEFSAAARACLRGFAYPWIRQLPE